MAKLTLFSARACPFAHRTRLVLAHKGVEFELQEIDLRNKPAWFSTVSGYGKVPAIEHDKNRIWESAVINEYLDEVFPDPPLLPSGAGRRALARLWIDWANTRLVPGFGAFLRGTSVAAREEAQRQLVEGLGFLEREGFAKQSTEGPFFFGSLPSLVDFTLYPWFERWDALETLRGPVHPGGFERVARWRDELSKLPAVKAHANPTAYYVERYAQYAQSAPPATREEGARA
jgi:glutathione S-transferase